MALGSKKHLEAKKTERAFGSSLDWRYRLVLVASRCCGSLLVGYPIIRMRFPSFANQHVSQIYDTMDPPLTDFFNSALKPRSTSALDAIRIGMSRGKMTRWTNRFPINIRPGEMMQPAPIHARLQFYTKIMIHQKKTQRGGTNIGEHCFFFPRLILFFRVSPFLIIRRFVVTFAPNLGPWVASINLVDFVNFHCLFV